MSELGPTPKSQFYSALLTHFEAGGRVMKNILGSNEDPIISELADHDFISRFSRTEQFVYQANQEADSLYFSSEEKVISGLKLAKAKFEYLVEAFALTDAENDAEFERIAEIVAGHETPLKELLAQGLSDRLLCLVDEIDAHEADLKMMESLTKLWCDENGYTTHRLGITLEEFKEERDKRTKRAALSPESANKLILIRTNLRALEILVDMNIINEDHTYEAIELSPFHGDLKWLLKLRHQSIILPSQSGTVRKTTKYETFTATPDGLTYRETRVLSRLDTNTMEFINEMEFGSPPMLATADQSNLALASIDASTQVLRDLENLDQESLLQALKDSGS